MLLHFCVFKTSCLLAHESFFVSQGRSAISFWVKTLEVVAPFNNKKNFVADGGMELVSINIFYCFIRNLPISSIVKYLRRSREHFTLWESEIF